jgi:exodeoxyribonuclease V beta subunit
MLSPETTNGERKMSNIIQLIELFHKMEKRQQYAPAELLNWLKRSMESDEQSGDEFEQRIESDGDAVQIITIHKCKGLEYNIVVAPFLDLLVKPEVDFFNFREPGEEEYYFINKGLISDQQKKWSCDDAEQENRRLFYVAMTRAKYALFVGSNTNHFYQNSTLRKFLNALDKDPDTAESFGIVRCDTPSIANDYRYTPVMQLYPVEFSKADHFVLLQRNWKKMSYSFLNPEHSIIKNQEKILLSDPYEQFVFHDLKKGVHTGNLLHYIFERIDFTDPGGWESIVELSAKRLSVNVGKENIQHLLLMLDHIIHLPLVIPGQQTFTLSQVKREERINELEFDFGVAPFGTKEIEALSYLGHPLMVRSHEELEGIMNGKIDLFFMQNGRYYILDWKSNHLGYQIADYDESGVLQAMTDNNYHLQYTIYTLALKKFLQTRLTNFDYDEHFGGVIYLFLRGIRKTGNTGLFYHKPDHKQILEMEKIFLQPV